MILTHLPALQVVIPLLAAPLCSLLGRGSWAWMLCVTVSWASFLVSALLVIQVMGGDVISYAMGGWEPPWGIELRIDALNALVLLLVTSVSTVIIAGARDSIAKEIQEDKVALYYTAYLLCLTGLIGITITGDAFNVFVFLEISSLSTYVLIAMGKDRRALTSSFRYLVMGTVGATFILISIGLMYMVTGTLNMADLAERIPAMANNSVIQAAFAFFVVGVCLKIALFPLHYWLPNAYAYAPSIATAFLAATATKVSLYVLIRFTYSVFGSELSFDALHLDRLLLPLSIVAIFVASGVAVYQTNVKRLLAYSSVAQIGYMTLGVGLVSVNGLTAGIVHMFNHALIKSALFLALAGVAYRLGSVELDKMRGIGKKMPWTMGAFAAAGLSLIGIPLTAGFVSKWYLIVGVLEKGWWVIGLLLVLSSLIAVVYVWRVVETAFLQEAPEDLQCEEAPLSILLPAWALVIANFWFGINTNWSVDVARRAAETLMGTAP